MGWIPIGAWIAAVAVTVVVLGFCAFEIVWKSNRLRRDLASLDADAEQLDALRARLIELRNRIAASGPG